MKKPTFSVIILTHNSEQYLDKTVKSVLSQKYQDYEIIILDDFSNDSTQLLIDKLTDHPKVKGYFNKNNQGISKSINKAVGLAKGDWILFLGHDDLLSNNHLTEMSKSLSKETSFIHCNSYKINEKDEIIGISKNQRNQLQLNNNPLFSLSINNYISSCGLVMNKQKFIECGGWETKYKNFGEWLLWVKLSKLGLVKYVTNTYCFYRKHSKSTILSMKDINRRYFLEKYKQQCRKEAFKAIKSEVSFFSTIYFWANYLFNEIMFAIFRLIARFKFS